MSLDAISRLLTVACAEALIFGVFWLVRGATIPFLGYALIGSCYMHLRNRPSVKEILWTLGCGLGAGAAYLAGGREMGSYFGATITAAGAFLGLGSLLVLGFHSVRSTPAMSSFLYALCCPLMMSLVSIALGGAVPALPLVWDHYLYQFDGRLGGQASFAVGVWFASWPWLQNVCFVVYSALPLAAAYLFQTYRENPGRLRVNALLVFMGAGVVGYTLFFVCPAVGPRHAFASAFPFTLPTVLLAGPVAVPHLPRNAMPSLHVTWALLIWWNLRGLGRWAGRILAVFTGFTLLATLGFGEHYFIDLVVALPLTMGMQAAFERRLAIAGAGILTTAAWVAALRAGWIPEPGIALAAVTATALLVVACAFRAPVIATLPAEAELSLNARR